MISYDYEPIYAMGSMLGISNPEGVLRLLEDIEILGFDAMSAGVVLSWATESQEAGLISEKDTLGIKFKWGDFKGYSKALRHIVNCENDFYEALARGVDYASSKYGGKDFALSFGGNEMAGYHTGPAAYIGFLTGARHSHLDNAGYSLDQKSLSSKEKIGPEETAEKLLSEEIFRQILSSLVVCFFARGVYSLEIVTEALRASGFDLEEDELMDLGLKILKMKYKYKTENGFDENKLRIPKRIFETPSPFGKFSEKYIRQAVSAYFNKLISD